ncbi:MAG TPA: DUF493 domain-containing protein [Pseudomonadales bacterium]
MTEPTPPKIEFPCDYPIRIMGNADAQFLDTVLAIVSEHAPDYCPDSVRVRDSSKGRFVSVHVQIVATGVDQLDRLHQALKAYHAVRMVL